MNKLVEFLKENKEMLESFSFFSKNKKQSIKLIIDWNIKSDNFFSKIGYEVINNKHFVPYFVFIVKDSDLKDVANYLLKIELEKIDKKIEQTKKEKQAIIDIFNKILKS